jgi:predicted flap endonuclease-1-like 5' DNA nuclease
VIVEPVPASPQTPVGTVETEAIEDVPVSPETPAVQPSAEALPASPETAAVADVPSQSAEETPVNPTANQAPLPTDQPQSKQEPSHMARTEFAEPERIAEKDAPPAPPAKADEAETSPRTSPEEQVVLESTADAPQPYETDQHGEVTPEAAASVAEGDGDKTQLAINLTEAASPAVHAQETSGSAARPDDLTRIDGIGEKLASILRTAGIDSFQKLANVSDTQLQEILQTANVRLRGNSSTWAQQAAYASQGDWESFKKFNRERKTRGGD